MTEIIKDLYQFTEVMEPIKHFNAPILIDDK